jgi:hypothetical protein
MRRGSARSRRQHCRTLRARGYITRAESAEQSVDYETHKKEKKKKEDAMVQIEARHSPALWRASFLVMGIAIIGTDTRSGQVMGDPTRPPHMNDARSGQVMGEPTRPQHMKDTTSGQMMNDTRSGQMMGDPTRPPHMNGSRSGQVMGEPTRPPHMKDTRSGQTMNDTRSGQVKGDPTRPPHMNDTRPGQVMGELTRPPHMKDTRSGQVMGDPTRPAQVMKDLTRPPHMNGTSHGQVMGDPTRVAKRTDGRSVEETLISMIPGVGGLFQLFSSPHLMGNPTRVSKRTDGRSLEETLISMIPGVGGLFQLFSSPHLYGPIRTALRHLGKRDATEGINLHRTRRFAPSLTTEWNKIHSGTCETNKECSGISMCTDDNTCYPQGRIILGCVAVFIIICSGISACICCPCRGLMGC